DLGAVLRAGHQRQLWVVVARQRVLLRAVHRRHGGLLGGGIGALPGLLGRGDLALRALLRGQVVLVLGVLRACGRLLDGRGLGRRLGGEPRGLGGGLDRRLGRGRRHLGGRRARGRHLTRRGRVGGRRGRSVGGRRFRGGRGRLGGGRALLLRAGERRRRQHRTDVELGGGRQRAGLLAVVAGHRDDEVVALDRHLGAGDTEAVDAVLDDLLRLAQAVL